MNKTKFPFVITRKSIQKMCHLNRRKASKDTKQKSIPEGRTVCTSARKCEMPWYAKRTTSDSVLLYREVMGEWRGDELVRRQKPTDNLHPLPKQYETDLCVDG